MNLKGKCIAVLGAGRSGLAAARMIAYFGGMPHVFDKSTKPRSDWDKTIPLTLGATDADGLAFNADIVVISPGIETESSFAQAFATGAEELIGEIELAYRFYSGRIIAITGTNGKTTTTDLIAKIILEAGKTVVACGNFGLPFAEVVMMSPQPEFVSLELSSFQLETMKYFHPEVAIWLNFAPDHLDRYPSETAYYQAKLHIFDNQIHTDVAIVRAGAILPPLKAQTFKFSSESCRASIHYANDAIWHGKDKLLSLEGTSMNIKHNAENVMAALLATETVGIPIEAIVRTLKTFAPPLHRCELVRILDGVEYYNDSKATNLHALESALRSQVKPTVLIAGGKNKGLDYSDLCPLLRKKVTHCIVFGEIALQLQETFKEACPISLAATLEDAIAQAVHHARKGDVVLFSPGTSSFDMFTGYEHRGDVYKKIVLDLK